MSEELLAAIDVRLGALEGRLRGDIHAVRDELRGEIRTVDQRVTDLDRRMHVLHEDTIDTIKTLAPDFVPIRREFQAADANLKEEIDRRLTPLEALARSRRSE